MRCALCPTRRDRGPNDPPWPWCGAHDAAFLNSGEHDRWKHYEALGLAGSAGVAISDFVHRMRAEALNAPKPK